MSKFKAGDKLRCIDPNGAVSMGEIYEFDFYTNDFVHVRGKPQGFYEYRFELAEEQPEEPKGTFESLLITNLPQGGYKVTAPGQTCGVHHQELSAHSTLAEAVAFVSRNMR